MAGFRVLIGILTWDAPNYVRKLLDNLEALSPALTTSFHVHIHDQGSCPDLVAEIQSWCAGNSNRSFSESIMNLGFAKGHNFIVSRFWEKSNFDYYLTLNSDMIFHSEAWLDRMVSYMDGHPEIAVAGPRINGIIQEGERRGHGYEIQQREVVHSDPQATVSGCLSIIRRKDIEEFGLYDTSFTPGYFEDADLVARYKHFGRKIGKTELDYQHAYLGKSECTSALKRLELKAKYHDFQDRNRQEFLNRWIDDNQQDFSLETLLSVFPNVYIPSPTQMVTITGPQKGNLGAGTYDIGPGCQLIYHPTAQVRGGAHFEIYDGGVVKLKEKVVIGMFNWVQGNGGMSIGKNTIFGPHVTLLSTMHQLYPHKPVREQLLRKAFLEIGEDVFVGANATISAGVTIARGSVVSSNSFVNRSTEPYSVNGGVPAKKIGSRKEVEISYRGLVVLATGNTERNNIYNTWTNLFLDISISLRSAGIDLFFVVHPNSQGKTAQSLDSDHLFLRQNHDDFSEILNNVNPDFICVWNGGTVGDSITIDHARRRDISIIYGEMGWLPQRDNICFDSKGVNTRSSVRDIDLDQVEIHQEFDKWKNDYLLSQAIRPVDMENYIFVPLQDENDTNIYKYSPFKRMNEFVRFLSHTLPDKQIVIRPHPRADKLSIEDFKNVFIRTDGSIYDWIYGAECIIGINSTVLVEATLTGKPVYGVGEGLCTGLGVIFDVEEPNDETFDRVITEDILDRRRRFLSFLVFQKQLFQHKATWLSELSTKTPFRNFLEDT